MLYAQKVQKYALNSQIQDYQILKIDDEVENWSLSSFLLAVSAFIVFCRSKKILATKKEIWNISNWGNAELTKIVFYDLLSTYTLIWWMFQLPTFSEPLLLVSTNPKYDKRLFIELYENSKLRTCWEHVLYTNWH